MMKLRLFAIALVPFALAGCSAYSELAARDKATGVLVDNDIRPIASYVVCNHSYSLFGLVPLSSGTPWQSGPYADRRGFNAKFFTDNCTLDSNLASVRAAMAECGSDRICSLVTTADDSWLWSFCVVKHHELKTTCLICEPSESKSK